ncbi:MAG: hypothetical protein PHD70_13240 [Anaerostipes sp.]|nr:hypothetical protein [Anaerostipes sp.]MDD3747421.1 hypothetical protein [Anaerostipes sp.]
MKDKTEKFLNDLLEIAKKNFSLKKYEKSLAAIEVAAHVLYDFNQRYTDDKVEKLLLSITDEIVVDRFSKLITDKKTVLYYDGFGLDTRGLTINYCKAIVENDYKLIYVTSSKARNTQKHLKHELSGFNVQYIYLNEKQSYVDKIDELTEIFIRTQSGHAFFYTQPFDVVGTVVFNGLREKVLRYQMDLTDHAFWLGVNAFDYCLDSRDIGQSIELYERHIDVGKLVRIKPSLYIDTLTEYNPLPFDTTKYRFIFSGGQLYKTYGDKNNTYYKIIDELLKTENVFFVYAGNGDTTEIDKLIYKYPNKVFYYKEREDFYEVIKRSVFYLNTYPMFGGLMTRYAAMAGKLPLTLLHGNESDGLLINQKQLKIEYDTALDLIKDAKELLQNNSYLKQRENLLIGSVVTFENFSKNLKQLLQEQKTEYNAEFIQVDTSKFRSECLERFNFEKTVIEAMVKKKNIMLFKEFPIVFVKGLIYKINNILKTRRKSI